MIIMKKILNSKERKVEKEKINRRLNSEVASEIPALPIHTL